jgi:arginase
MPVPSRKVDLIGVASALGGADNGCADAPQRLAEIGLERQLAQAGIDASWAAMYAPARHGDGAPAALARLTRTVAARVAESLRAARFPCVIGGDHSCAVGTWSGVAAALAPRGQLGLVWIDAHMDSHTPGTSPSGNLHGMPLAALLGERDHALEGLEEGVLRPRHVCLVGVRSYEPAEADRLARLGVRVFAMDEIERRGLTRVMADALDIANEGTVACGITLDLDALDPHEAPAVAVPEPQGIGGDELVTVLARIAREPRLVAFELAEYCPRLDRDGRSAQLIARLLQAALGGVEVVSQRPPLRRVLA